MAEPRSRPSAAVPRRGEVAPASAAGVALAIEVCALEVLGGLASAGVPAVLLKGPTIARWLYDNEFDRRSWDVDVLVPVDGLPAARGVLERLGFGRVTPDTEHAESWSRARDGMLAELHWTLPGVVAPPQRVWELLAADGVEFALGQGSVRALAPDARALHVALHAVHHGARDHPLEDLRRAVERLSPDMWAAAGRRARELGAEDVFGAGLRLVPRGEKLAAQLALPGPGTPRTALLASTPPPGALTMEELARLPGPLAKARLVARRLFPSAPLMRARSPLARRGRAGLALAHAQRLLTRVVNLVPAWRAVRRARRR